MANKSAVTFTLKGAKELNEALVKMDQKTSRNVVTRAVRISLAPVVQEIRKKIKSDLHTMNARARAQYAKHIGISVDRSKTGIIRARIRTKSIKIKSASSKRLINYSPLAHLFEGGVSPHKIKQKKRTINHPGIQKMPIWGTTFVIRGKQMVDSFMNEMWKNIKKEWDKVPNNK